MTDESATAAVKPYLALRFSPITPRTNFETPVFPTSIVTTKKVGEDPDEPFKIPPGDYYLVLQVLEDEPVLDNSNGYCYPNAKWHMEPEITKPMVTDKKPVDICVVQKLVDSGNGHNKKFTANPQPVNTVALGIIKVERGRWCYKLVGEIHRFFWRKGSEPDWQPDIVIYKALSSNPEFQILAE